MFCVHHKVSTVICLDLGYIKGFDLTVIVENHVTRRDLLAEHGLSLFLQIKDKSGDTLSYFFDAGQTEETLKNNLELLKIPLKNVKGIIISHGHYDHTGGLLALIDAIPHQAKLISHKYLFKPKIYHERNKPVREIGVPFSQKYVESLKVTPYYITKPKVISEGVGVITEIPIKYQFEINTHFITGCKCRRCRCCYHNRVWSCRDFKYNQLCKRSIQSRQNLWGFRWISHAKFE